MAVASRARAEPLRYHWRDRETSPERTKVWTEPKPRKVPVVYYLSRNGQLEHPHFMEVALSAGEGLHLKDVIDRLNALRGKGMANAYAWSCKRSYKNGFVWHDLTEDDLIHPTSAHEYVLKGSERLISESSPSSRDTVAASAASYSSTATASTSSGGSEKTRTASDDAEIKQSRKKKTPWSSFDLNEYKVYRNDLTVDDAPKAVDASTQTDERRSRWRPQPPPVVPEDDCDERGEVPRAEEISKMTSAAAATTELECDEISPPPSSSSPETLESLIKADCRTIAASSTGRTGATGAPDVSVGGGGEGSGRVRASAVLMHLISCGSISAKGGRGRLASVVPHFRGARLLPRGGSDLKEAADCSTECSSAGGFSGVLRLEDKEYFSGSLVETKKKSVSGDDSIAGFPGLKRSTSYNADRSSKLELAGEAEKETDDDAVRAKCIPRKPKGAAATRRGPNAPVSRSNLGSSKRIDDEPKQM